MERDLSNHNSDSVGERGCKVAKMPNVRGALRIVINQPGLITYEQVTFALKLQGAAHPWFQADCLYPIREGRNDAQNFSLISPFFITS